MKLRKHFTVIALGFLMVLIMVGSVLLKIALP